MGRGDGSQFVGPRSRNRLGHFVHGFFAAHERGRLAGDDQVHGGARPGLIVECQVEAVVQGLHLHLGVLLTGVARVLQAAHTDSPVLRLTSRGPCQDQNRDQHSVCGGHHPNSFNIAEPETIRPCRHCGRSGPCRSMESVQGECFPAAGLILSCRPLLLRGVRREHPARVAMERAFNRPDRNNCTQRRSCASAGTAGWPWVPTGQVTLGNTIFKHGRHQDPPAGRQQGSGWLCRFGRGCLRPAGAFRGEDPGLPRQHPPGRHRTGQGVADRPGPAPPGGHAGCRR